MVGAAVQQLNIRHKASCSTAAAQAVTECGTSAISAFSSLHPRTSSPRIRETSLLVQFILSLMYLSIKNRTELLLMFEREFVTNSPELK